MRKRCCVCKTEFPLEDFHRNSARRDGHTECCKKCAIARVHVWREENLERARENEHCYAREHREQARVRAKEWYRKNREYALAENRKSRQEHSEEVRARDRARSKTDHFKAVRQAYRKNNSDKVRETKRRAYIRHREEILKKQQIYTAKNKEKILRRNKEWRARNPEKVRAIKDRYDRRKRASIAGVLCSLTQEQWEAILTLHSNRCAYCGRDGVRLEKEHVVPLSKGGPTTADNIVPACRSCNASKHTKMLNDWIH